MQVIHIFGGQTKSDRHPEQVTNRFPAHNLYTFGADLIMPRNLDLNQFRQALEAGLVVKAHCGAVAFPVTAIGAVTAKAENWNIPLGKVTRFEIDKAASLGF
jgi:hypothetical protein